jgi:hypothetical protein
MDKVHKPITTQYYTPSSKPFRIHQNQTYLSFLTEFSFFKTVSALSCPLPVSIKRGGGGEQNYCSHSNHTATILLRSADSYKFVSQFLRGVMPTRYKVMRLSEQKIASFVRFCFLICILSFCPSSHPALSDPPIEPYISSSIFSGRAV